MANNSLYPHGGKIVERIMEPKQTQEKTQGLAALPIGGQMTRECPSIAYDFFSPLEGFMLKANVDSVTKDTRLTHEVNP